MCCDAKDRGLRNTGPLARRQDRPGNARRRRWLVGCASLALLWASPAAATPWISELFYDAVGVDDGEVFVEIAGTPGMDLTGYLIEGINGSNGAVGPSITLSGVIPASGLFVLADQTSGGTTNVAAASQLANFDFQNGPDSVVLSNNGSIVDALGYGQFAPSEIFAGEGSPAEDPDAGWSLARPFADVDTDDNSLDFVALATPTPGVATFQSVPEPSTALLMGSGATVVAARRRGAIRRSRLARAA